MTEYTQHTADPHYEHALTGKWTGPGMQIVFGSPMEKGMAKLSGATEEPSQSMDYTLYERDGVLWIKFQNNIGERNYRIVSLTKTALIIENDQGRIALERMNE